MTKFKSLKTVFLASAITIGVSALTSQNVLGASETYTVKSGDCLSVIAKNNGLTLNELRIANNKWDDSIFPGQVIKLSADESAAVENPTQTNDNSAKTYTVIKGDCLYSIAQTYGLSLSDLRAANNKWNDLVSIGEVLKITVSTSPATQPTTTPTSNSTPEATPANNNSLKTYTVKSGDSLYSIAKSSGLLLNDLRTYNNKWNDTILVGQVLNIVATTTATPVTSTPVTSTPVITNTGAIKYTESELNLLSRLISSEARGESYNGQVAVGAIVVNRVKSGYFPNSITAVINEQTNGNYQFSPVKSGSINTPATASSLKAAIEALGGNDPTNNALFFYSGKVPSALTAPQPVSVVIGNFTFVYLIK